MNPRASSKQAELVVGIAAEIEGAVAKGIPADAVLTGLYRAHREFGSRDRASSRPLYLPVSAGRAGSKRFGSQTRPRNASSPACSMRMRNIRPSGRWLRKTRFRSVPLSPLGSLSLAEKAKRIAGWTGAHTPPAVADLLPDWAPAALQIPPNTDPGDHIRRCIESFQSRPPTWLRIRRRFQSEVEKVLTAHRVPFETSCLASQHHVYSSRNVRPDPGSCRTSGRVEIQDLASQAVGLVCDPAPGSHWWDVCAGAMGKTLHLADLMNETGRILATDVRESALSQDTGGSGTRGSHVSNGRHGIWIMIRLPTVCSTAYWLTPPAPPLEPGIAIRTHAGERAWKTWERKRALQTRHTRCSFPKTC